jgi:hypothetical protein
MSSAVVYHQQIIATVGDDMVITDYVVTVCRPLLDEGIVGFNCHPQRVSTKVSALQKEIALLVKYAVLMVDMLKVMRYE